MLVSYFDKIFEKTISYFEKSEFLMSILIIITAFFVTKVIRASVYRTVLLLSKDKNSEQTNILLKSYCNIIANVIKYLIYTIAFFIILLIYNVEIGVMITSAGFIGVMITYIFQFLIQDVTSGFFIVFSAPFKIGDKVKIYDFIGEVKEIQSRFIIIEDEKMNRFMVSNREVSKVIIYSEE